MTEVLKVLCRHLVIEMVSNWIIKRIEIISHQFPRLVLW